MLAPSIGTACSQVVSFILFAKFMLHFILPSVFEDIEQMRHDEEKRLRSLEKAKNIIEESSKEAAMLKALTRQYCENMIKFSKEDVERHSKTALEKCRLEINMRYHDATLRINKMVEESQRRYKDEVYETSMKLTKNVLSKYLSKADKTRILESIMTQCY